MSEPQVEFQTEEQPEVLGGVVAYLQIDGADKAAKFYEKAFAAKEVARAPLDESGRTMHIHLYINGSSVMLSDPYPEHGYPAQTPQGFTMHLHTDNVDMWWDRAAKTDLKIELPLQKMFWGERYGSMRDPFGVLWSMSGE